MELPMLKNTLNIVYSVYAYVYMYLFMCVILFVVSSYFVYQPVHQPSGPCEIGPEGCYAWATYATQCDN